ncbi:hypothetical protein J6J34_01385 [Pseudidiomarina sp. 1ASP75-14]|uniref:hypothetical protein n=1 Tax=Pseudidiomarina terrestris TaxID=2820060 RepID=UPI002653A885|nr:MULTISPECIES: hypothetical protein [unclassified Pseudidiomarina]MDN7127029.1 hypothetical protein [Pseudidiomarina sp. 1APR75-33.1]MDN7136871.1 hypothetical protein [Pseudidiomarina sp. 1ASP75-14]
MRTTIRRALLGSVLMGSVTAAPMALAAEETIQIKGELLFSSLPALVDHQGPLSQPLTFTATVVQDPEQAVPAGFFSLGTDYLNATLALRMEITGPAGDVLYDRTVDVDNLPVAASVDALSWFLFSSDAQGSDEPSGSALWAIISASDEQFIRREITLGQSIFNRNLGGLAEVTAGVSSLFTDTSGYPVLAEGSYNYTFLYYDNTIDNITGAGDMGMVQGYATRVSYGGDDADADGIADDADSCPASDTRSTVVFDWNDSGVTNYAFADGCTISDEFARCNTAANCTMKLIKQLNDDGSISLEEANVLRNASQVGYHSRRPR